MSAREASNASPRWADGGRDDHRDVADREPTDPVDSGDAVHVVLARRPGRRPGAARRARSGARSTPGPRTSSPWSWSRTRPTKSVSPPDGLVVERGHDLGDVERCLAEVDETDDAGIADCRARGRP